MEKNEISEEVTVTPIISDIERLFGRFIRFVQKLVYGIFEGGRNFLMFVLKHFWIFLIVSVLGGALGFFSTHLIPRQYTSSMVVKMNVDAKDQLMNDIGYINALIGKGAEEELSALFSISQEEAGTLTGCEVYAFSSYVERAKALNELYQNTDTALYRNLDTEVLLNSSSSDLSSKFKISINATDQTVFSKLEKPLLNYLERVPEINKLLASSRKALKFQREIFLGEMIKIDTLAAVMNAAMIERAKAPGQSGSNTYLLFGEEGAKNEMNALDLQDRYIFYAQKVSKIEVAIEEHETCYFVNSHLNPFGQKTGYGGLARAIILALLFFGITYVVLLVLKSAKKAA